MKIKQKEFEAASEELQTEIDVELEDIGGTGLSLRSLVASEDAYQLISIYMKQRIVDAANEHAAIVHSYKSEIAVLEQTASELSKIKAEYEAIHKENMDLADEISDLNSKRDAAAREIDTLKAENERLKEDNVKLREQLESRNKPVNTSEDIAKFAEKIKAGIKPIFNLRWENDIKRTHYLANLAETGEEIRIVSYAINSFRVVEGEELARFQAEQEAKELAKLAEEVNSHVAPSGLPMPIKTNAEVQTDSTNGEVAHDAETVTRAEFQSVLNRMDAIETELRQRGMLKEIA